MCIPNIDDPGEAVLSLSSSDAVNSLERVRVFLGVKIAADISDQLAGLAPGATGYQILASSPLTERASSASDRQSSLTDADRPRRALISPTGAGAPDASPFE